MFHLFVLIPQKQDHQDEEIESVIKEGSAEIRGKGNVFYNPVQEFNRDLSICVLSTFISDWAKTKEKELASVSGEKDEVRTIFLLILHPI